MTAIVLIIFNRPEMTERVFQIIGQVRPEKLFVIADGPRLQRAQDAELVKRARAVIDGLTWSCQIFKNYSDVNLGCNNRISSGLDWVFGQVDEAIILEDDCIPDLSFFEYCQELLTKYRDDSRIMHISGNRFVPSKSLEGADYSFSRYPHCWGWATWQRAWKNYDKEMSKWPTLRQGDWLEKILERPSAIRFWKNIFDLTYEGKISSWAYRWTMACWINQGLSINPRVNLVSNIGFGIDATHTKDSQSSLSKLPIFSISMPLCDPTEIKRDVEADQISEKEVFNITSPQYKVFNRIKKMFKES